MPQLQYNNKQCNDFYFETARNDVPPYNSRWLVGKLRGATGIQQIWSHSGQITRATTEAPLLISSTSTLDITQTLLIEGVNQDFTYISETVTLTGKTPVITKNVFYRINFTTLNVATTGEVYIYYASTVSNGIPTDVTKIQGVISIGELTAFNAFFTCPRDKKVYMSNICYAATGGFDVTHTNSNLVVLTGNVFYYLKTPQDTEFKSQLEMRFVISSTGQWDVTNRPFYIPPCSEVEFSFELLPTGAYGVDIDLYSVLIFDTNDSSPLLTDIKTKKDYLKYLSTSPTKTVTSTQLCLVGYDSYPTKNPTTFNKDNILLTLPGNIDLTLQKTSTIALTQNNSTPFNTLLTTHFPTIASIWKCIDSSLAITYVMSTTSTALINCNNNSMFTLIGNPP